MVKGNFGLRWRALARGCCAVGIATILCTSPEGYAQLFGHHSKEVNPPAEQKANVERPASQPATFKIPVEPLGFFAPGAIYQGQRESLVSLDFLDEDHLLFTFHAPGLIRREGSPKEGDERQI